MLWDLSAENIAIEVQVRTKGYVGLGFSPIGGMKSADMVIGWVTNSQVILQDRFSADCEEPTIDDNQDYEFISGVRIHNINAIMSPQAYIKFATAAYAAITLLCYCECTTKWQNEMILDPKGDFQMFWDLGEDNITIEVQVRTKGYVAFGFSPIGGMKSADIVVAWVTNSKVVLQDRFSADYVEPTIDDNQDYELISGSENGTHTIVRFTRILETCDKQDLPIVNGTMYIIYAWGTDDPLSEEHIEYHGRKNRGSKAINLMAPNVELDPTTDDMHQWDIPFPKVVISPGDTTYVCFVTKIPPVNKKMHIASMQVLQPANEIQLHHLFMFQCFDQFSNLVEKELDVADRYCSKQLFCQNPLTGFAVSDNIEVSPNFGIQFGRPDRPTYYYFQIHYDNPTFRNGSVDQATLHLIATEKLRKYDVGTALIWGLIDIIIPPQQPNFTYSAIFPSECTAKNIPVDGINIVTVQLHAHLTVTKMYFRHFRHGVELPLIAYSNNYDFRIQKFVTLHKEVKVLPGDILAVQCEFNTMDRTNFTMGGMGSSDEMCMAAFTYYPKSDLFLSLTLRPRQDVLQMLQSASSKQSNNKNSHISKMLPYGFVKNFNASILTEQDIYELSYVQTYGKMDALCIDSAGGFTHVTADYPKNITSISYEEESCKPSRNRA